MLDREMAYFGNHYLVKVFIALSLAGIVSGGVFDEILDNSDNLLYVAIGFICLSVLFLFAVILMLSVVVIRVKKILKSRDEGHTYHTNSDTVIGNPYAVPMSERRWTDPPKWDQYLRNGTEHNSLNTVSNMDYSHYMDTIILDASKVSLPRATVKITEQTI